MREWRDEFIFGSRFGGWRHIFWSKKAFFDDVTTDEWQTPSNLSFSRLCRGKYVNFFSLRFLWVSMLAWIDAAAHDVRIMNNTFCIREKMPRMSKQMKAYQTLKFIFARKKWKLKKRITPKFPSDRVFFFGRWKNCCEMLWNVRLLCSTKREQFSIFIALLPLATT